MPGHDHDHHHHEHSELSETQLRVRALETVLIEKGYVDPAALDLLIETYEKKVGPRNGARVVAKAWADPAYRARLMKDATPAIAEIGYAGRRGEHIVALENTPKLHNMDMGGKHGFGPVKPEPNEPVFHDEWEKRAFALTLAMGMPGGWNIDMGRFARENRPPGEYLSMTYYQIWFAALESMIRERGLVSDDEIAAGHSLRPPKPVKRVLA